MASKYVKVNGEYYLLSCVKCSRFKDCTEKKLAFEIKRSITMDLENIKRGLRAEIKKRENEQYSTFQTNVREMCKDVLDKLEEQESLINEMKEAAADIGFKWQEYDAGEDAWEDTHKGKWVKAEEPVIDLHDWNDISNTKIPLNAEIFALLVDRHNPEKLRPAVIVAKMVSAKSLTWTENKEGDALCYDIPIGNFHCCNGAEIKYWKYVNIPSKQAKT